MSGDVPVDAVCTGCSQTCVRWVSEDEDEGSFRHVCYVCQSVQWMNTVARLSGLKQDGGDEK